MGFDPALLAGASAGLLAGALSGVHCAAMCTGIVSAHAAIPIKVLSIATPSARLQSRPFTRNLAFNTGRIASYTIAGALAGSISAAAFVIHDSMPLRQTLFALANIMLISLGLYLAGLWRGITVLERGGALIWRRIQPFAAALLASPLPAIRHSLALGALWGWIPCGLVYAMLVTALASGNAIHGALIMFAFGLGTLPNLLALGWAGVWLGKYLRDSRLRSAAGWIIIGFGIIGLWRLPQLAQLDGWGALCQPTLNSIRSWLGA